MPNAVVAASAFAALLAAVAVAILRRFAPRLPADVPNARSLHVDPVPRAGRLRDLVRVRSCGPALSAAVSRRSGRMDAGVGRAVRGIGAGRSQGCACHDEADRARRCLGVDRGVAGAWRGLRRCASDGSRPGRRLRAHACMVGQPLQFHGRQRRSGGGHGHLRIRCLRPCRNARRCAGAARGVGRIGVPARRRSCAVCARGGDRSVLRRQSPAGLDVPGRCRGRPAGVPRRGFRHRGCHRRALAGMVPAAGIPALHRRRHADPAAPRPAPRAPVGRAIAATITSACTDSAQAMPERSPSMRRR